MYFVLALGLSHGVQRASSTILSSLEAKYVAATSITCQVVRLRITCRFWSRIEERTKILYDNKAQLQWLRIQYSMEE